MKIRRGGNPDVGAFRKGLLRQDRQAQFVDDFIIGKERLHRGGGLLSLLRRGDLSPEKELFPFNLHPDVQNAEVRMGRKGLPDFFFQVVLLGHVDQVRVH